MTISKCHAYQPMVRMWFTGRFLEGLIFEVITVGLLRELSVSAYLKEIDLAGDCHKEFKRAINTFSKGLLIFAADLRTSRHSDWYCISRFDELIT